jgi:TPR repeat protein
MSRISRFTCLLGTAIVFLTFGEAHAASKVGILPPDLDYKKMCIKPEVLTRDDFNWTGKTAATSRLPDEQLVKLARLYLNGSVETLPNYNRVKDIVGYLKTKGGEIRGDALQIEFLMIWDGKGAQRNLTEAKKILNQMVANDQPEAYGYLGDVYAEEGNYLKAAENYKKAYTLGRNEAAVSLAYLYGEGKIPASEEDINQSISIAQDMLMSYIYSGRCNALTTMGLMYDRLKFIPKAEELSAKWFEKAAELDEISPKLYLAEIVQRGFVIDYDEQKILRLWKEAAALGSSKAMFLLGERGVLNHKSDNELRDAASWLQKAAERGHVKAMENLAVIYSGQYPGMRDDAKRRRWLEAAAARPEAKDKTLMRLTALYENDPAVPPEKVFDLYQKAAEKGNAEAYMKIGDSYRYGFGVPALPVKALRYYRLSANAGEVTAMHALKQAYACQIGVPSNAKMQNFWDGQINFYSSGPSLDKAYAYLAKGAVSSDEPGAEEKEIVSSLHRFAAAGQDVEAMVLLGIYYDKKKDQKQADDWIKKALESDKRSNEEYSAHALLGDILLEGVILEKNLARSKELLKVAADANNSGAQKTLGKLILESGQRKEGETYLLRAAKNGKVEAYIDLAELSIEKNDLAQAVQYLENAARHNDVKAMLKLAEGYDANGWIKKADPQKSKEWFEKSLKGYPCESGEYIQIAGAFLGGKYGIAANEQEAQKWLDKMSSSVPGDDGAKLDIVKAILGSSLIKNKEKQEFAVRMLEDMAKKDNKEAIVMLSDLYMNKDFEGYDVKKGIQWLTNGAENGDVSLMLSLANIYISGFGVPASMDKSVMWLEKAKEAGSQEAAQRLQSLTSGQVETPLKN